MGIPASWMFRVTGPAPSAPGRSNPRRRVRGEQFERFVTGRRELVVRSRGHKLWRPTRDNAERGGTMKGIVARECVSVLPQPFSLFLT